MHLRKSWWLWPGSNTTHDVTYFVFLNLQYATAEGELLFVCNNPRGDVATFTGKNNENKYHNNK